LWSSDWRCAHHGAVHPYHVLAHSSTEAIEHVAALAKVPVWLPHGLAAGWTCSGAAYVGDERSGALAIATCLAGPSPLGGPAELLLVAEEPGIGLGARHAGLLEPDPGGHFEVGQPDAKLSVAGHPTAVWSVPSVGDRAVFVGEAKGLWLWAIVCPAAAGVLMYDGMSLVDARDAEPDPDLGFGPVSALLSAVPPVG
jgi:hypothetical protein